MIGHPILFNFNSGIEVSGCHFGNAYGKTKGLIQNLSQPLNYLL